MYLQPGSIKTFTATFFLISTLATASPLALQRTAFGALALEGELTLAINDLPCTS
ncbi:hypothetical protein SCHPADRAFT_910604 [Schizopora paradoxa]|uniref:Uncharacterized protein n=1 Tax=Schizopora paradoxa TaxID=27342 RepID=A0A0H2R3W3_9AGAM|nr:hypothetical protein SCHPADRAFT_910604 [Schizopora paradoxa]